MNACALLEKLDEQGLSLIILSGRRTLYTSKGSGIKPLVDAISSVGIDRLKDTIVVDRVVGKASALLICYFGAKKVYSKLISRRGADFLKTRGVEHFAETSTREIRNRANTDICPFEKIVLQVHDPVRAYELLRSGSYESVCRQEK